MLDGNIADELDGLFGNTGEEEYMPPRSPPTPTNKVPNTPPPLQQQLEDVYDRRSFTNIENWYEDLKQFTFTTTFIPLSAQDMTAIVENSMFHSFSSLTHTTTNNLSITDKSLLNAITAKIESQLCLFSNGFFMKTSARSPKDAAILDIHKFENTIRNVTDLAIMNERDVFGILLSDYEDSDDIDQYLLALNSKMILLYRSAASALHLYDASHAQFLLLNSERVYMDFRRALRDNYTLNLVLREWKPNSKIEWEFRGFVYNGTLTCCAQYLDLCYIKRLADMKEHIGMKIQTYFESVKHHITFNNRENYTLDFGYDPNSDEFWIVEVNNPPPVADTGLYNWKDPLDRNIIEHGPFELRVRQSPATREELLEEIPPHIMSIFRKVTKELKKKYKNL